MSDTSTDWFSDETATIGDRIAGAREAAGMQQSELAERLGVKLDVIEAWEDDVKEPRSNRLLRLSGVLNVSVMWLLNGEGDGISAPDETPQTHRDIGAVLKEVADIRKDISNNAERLAQLENRLRQMLGDSDER